MSISFFVALRFIKSRKNSRFLSVISTITMAGIALGVAVVIIALSILDGFERVVSEKIVDLNSHIKITGFGGRSLPDPDLVMLNLKREFGREIKEIVPFNSKLGIIKSRKYTEGITVNGLTAEALKSILGKLIVAGEIPEKKLELPTIYIGKKLAEKLFVKIGDRVTVFSLQKEKIPTADNPPSIQQFIVAGIFESTMSEYDDLLVYTDLKTTEEIFGLSNEVSGYNIQLYSGVEIDSMADKLQDFLGYPFYVRSIFKVHQNIFTWLELQKKPIPLVLGLIIFVAVFNIVGTLLMIVLEKTSAVGVLRSYGAARSSILKIFLIYGIYLTILGVMAGNVLALVLSWLQINYNIIALPGTIYFVSRVPLVIEPINYLIVSVATAIISISTALVPAYFSTKIKTISALRFE